MLAKFSLSILIGAGLLSNCLAQSGAYQNALQFNQVAQVGYTVQEDEEVDPEELSKQIERLELRLRELENDVEKKLDTEPQEKEAEEAEDFGARIARLEKGFQTQSAAIEKVEGNLPGLVYHSHGRPKLQFFGRVHLDYWAFPDVDESLFPLEAGGNPQDRVIFRRLRIGVKGDLTDNMFYKYEGEFANGVNTSFRDAFLGFKEVPILQTVIIGNHKRPYSLDQLNSSNNNIFIERPFIAQLINRDNRRLGISANGTTEDLGWNWRYGVWNQEVIQSRGGYIGDHYQLEVAARIARMPWYDDSSGGRGYAHFAVAGSVGEVDGAPGTTNNQADFRTRAEARTTTQWIDTGPIAGADVTALIGLETAINVGSFHFGAEFMRNNIDRLDAIGEDVAFDGGYVQASYIWTGEHHPWNRKTGTLGRLVPYENFFTVRDCDGATKRGWGAFETSIRYSWVDANDFDINGGEASSWTIGLNWYWNEYSRMQFNYLTGSIENGPGGFGGDYDFLGVRMMVNF